MAQFARPSSDVSNAGSWATQPTTGQALYAQIDETAASDTDYCVSPSNPSNAAFVVGLGSVTDPATGTGHVMRVRYAKSASGGRTIDLTFRLLQGGTQIASRTITNLSEVVTTSEFTLSGGEADAITDYGALRFEFSANVSGSGGGRACAVTWAELETPDAASVTEKSGSDSGSGAEGTASLSSTFSTGETGAGAEGTPAVSATADAAESGAGAETASGSGTLAAAEETGAGVDASALVVILEGAETGAGAEGAASVAGEAAAGDTGAGAEEASGSATLSGGEETGSGADEGLAAVAVSSADAGSGAEEAASSGSLAAAESAAGVEAQAAESVLSAGETGAGTEEASNAATLAGTEETGAGTEEAQSAVAVSGADTGSGTESAESAAVLDAAEAGTAVDAAALSGTLEAGDTGSAAEGVPAITGELASSGETGGATGESGSYEQLSDTIEVSSSDTGAGTDSAGVFATVASAAGEAGTLSEPPAVVTATLAPEAYQAIVTAGRRTRLVLDVSSPLMTRPAWTFRRYGEQIQRGRGRWVTTEGVVLRPGGGWTLAAPAEDLTRLIHNDGLASVIGGSDVNLAPGWVATNTYRKPTDLPGVGASGSLVASGAPLFQKRVAAGASWDAGLPADVSAFPMPTLPTQDVPMNRVLASKATLPLNAGLALQISTPGEVTPPDNLCTLYFGGPAEIRDGYGGEFALTLRGDGRALLQEREADGTWRRRFDFAWSNGPGAGNLDLDALLLFPYGRDTLAIYAAGADLLGGSAPYLPLAAVSLAQGHRRRTFYRSSPHLTGYVPGTSLTGPGLVRLDVRRDLRTLFGLARLRPVASGTLVDLPFRVPFPVAADMELVVRTRRYEPLDSVVSVQLFNAETGAPLLQIGPATFRAVAGVQTYFAIFTFTRSSSAEQTPVLWGYAVEIPGAEGSRVGAQLALPVHRTSVTGPDTDPSHDSAHVEVKDAKNEAGILNTRARIPCRINLYADDGVTVVSTLFEGEIARAPGLQRGTPGRLYPSPEWKDYSASAVGVWARVESFPNVAMWDFRVDESVAPGPDGYQPPWQITSIIRKLLRVIGFASDQVAGIPELPMRLWPSGEGGDDGLLLPGVSFAQYLQLLCREYLGMILCWDPNASTRGTWRLLDNPQPPYGPPLFSFIPPPAGKLATHPFSYGPGQAWWEKDTWSPWVRAPEANYIEVRGVSGGEQIVRSMYNPVSFDFTGPTSNPLDPDYLGFFAPLYVVDPGLQTEEAVMWVLRRLFDRAAHAEKWLQFRGPLLLVTDPLDPLQTRPRPLRINDYGTVKGFPALVRSCNPDYRKDSLQMAEYQFLLLT